MQQDPSSSRLRAVLWVDAIVGLSVAAMHLAVATWLASWMELPAQWLLVAGLVILPYAGLAAFLALQVRPVLGLLRALVLGNFAWGVAALAIVLGGAGLQFNAWGMAYLWVHAVSVVVMGALEWFWGLRRSAALPAVSRLVV